MKKLITLVAAAMLTFALAVPAFAATGADGAGVDYGTHHATHAQEMTGFTATENPGVMHQGFSGWSGM